MSADGEDIRSWLEGLGLGEYAAAFEGNHITVESLASLTAEDLKDLGVASLGHRKTLLAEIAKRGSAPTEERDLRARSSGQPDRAAEAGATPSKPSPVAIPVAPPVRAAQTRPEVAFHHSAQGAAPAVKRPGFRARLLASKFLFVSIVAHLLFGVGATYYVVQRIQAKRKVTFQGGPPSVNASKRALEHKVSMAQKKKTGGAPPQARRIVSAGIAKVALPDLPTIPTATNVAPGMMAGMGGAGFGTGMGFGSGAGSGMGGGGGGGGMMSFFGFRGAGGGLAGSFYDLKQTRDRKSSGVNANNYTGIVRQWVDGGMKESELAKYFKAPATLSSSQFMIPDMPANEAPKAFAVEKDVKPAQWLAVYRGKVMPPKEGNYQFIGAADDVLLVKVNGKLVLDASWAVSSSLKPEEIIPPQYSGFPRKGYIRGETVHFSGTSWADMEVVIGERPGGHFWAVLMAVPSGTKSGNMPLFRLANVKTPKSDGPPFPKCDLNGPLWRAQPTGGGSLLDSLKRP